MQKTIENLAKAFVGESQARNRYTIYAKIAKKEGFEQISEIFLETADQEREHAKWLMRMIEGLKGKSEENYSELGVDVSVPTVVGTTEENIKAAAEGENYEHTTMYPEFANVAEREGLEQIAKRLRSIAIAEKHHEDRYRKFLKQVQSESVFERKEETTWVCRKCGYTHKGKTPPDACPSCGHPKNYFQIQQENY